MNQLDESVVAPTSPISDSLSPSASDQATEIPATVTPTAPMTFSTNLPDIQSPSLSENSDVVPQAIIDSHNPTLPTANQTPTLPTQPTGSLASSMPSPELIKTVPMPAQDNTDGIPLVETKPLEMPQVSSPQPLPSMSSPIPNSIPDISAMPTPSIPSVSTNDVLPASELPQTEPLHISTTLPTLSNQSVPSLGMSNSVPPLSENSGQAPALAPQIDPVAVETKAPQNPEPLPAPLTPPTIKTSPTLVSSNPNSSQTVAPVDVTMSGSIIEPLNKPVGQVAPILVKGAGKYQIRVINEKCIGAASCVAVAPKAFKLNEQQIAEVLASASEESDENLLLSAQSCPTMAIEIIDSETGKKVWPR